MKSMHKYIAQEVGTSSVEIIAVCAAVLILIVAVRSVLVNGGIQTILNTLDSGIAIQIQRYDQP